MKNMRKIVCMGLMLAIFVGTVSSCKKSTSMPCPGLGQSTEGDISQFDENGQLKNGKGKKKKGPTKRINHESGLVDRKQPKNLKAPRKTQL